MLIVVLTIVALAILAGLGAFASYLRLLMRRLSPVASRKVFPIVNGDQAGTERERIGISLSALHGALMACFAAGVTELVFSSHPDHPWASLGSALLIILGVIAIFDQLIPFMLVARHDEPEKILLEWCPLLRRTVYAASPLIFPILISTSIRRLLETDEPEAEEPTPQEDLQELLEVGQQEGLIEKEEGEILQSVVEFGETLVREIMTPRTEIAALEINASAEDLRALFREKRHSRFPVYEDNLDQIQGFVIVGDLMESPPEVQSQVTLRSLLKPVPFVPETKRSLDLLKEMQRSTTQLAIVIDEYGSVAGLVTLEDLLEEIVGEIRGEVEPHDRDILQEGPHSYLVAGHTGLDQLAETIGQPIQEGEYSTVAGLLLAILGHVPQIAEKVESGGLTIEVVDANPRTVLKVRVRTAAEIARPDRVAASAGGSGRS